MTRFTLMFEVGARSGHPNATDVIAAAGICFGIALQAFSGHPASTDVVARTAAYYQSIELTVTEPEVPTATGIPFIRYHYLIRNRR